MTVCRHELGAVVEPSTLQFQPWYYVEPTEEIYGQELVKTQKK